jgi:hypothetical protein
MFLKRIRAKYLPSMQSARDRTEKCGCSENAAHITHAAVRHRRAVADAGASERGHFPSKTGCLPLNHSGNPGVNVDSYWETPAVD